VPRCPRGDWVQLRTIFEGRLHSLLNFFVTWKTLPFVGGYFLTTGKFGKAGVPKKEVASKVVEFVPFGRKYVEELLPREFKEPEKASAGQKSREKVASVKLSLTEPKEAEKMGFTPTQMALSELWNICTYLTRPRRGLGSTGGFARGAEEKYRRFRGSDSNARRGMRSGLRSI